MLNYDSIPTMDEIGGYDVLRFEEILKTMTTYESLGLSENDARRIMRHTSQKMRQLLELTPTDVNYNPYLIHHVLGIDEAWKQLVVMRITDHRKVTDFTEVRDATEYDMKEYPLVNEEFCPIS